MTSEQPDDNGRRTQMWLDSLDDDEHTEAKRIIDMPGGNMATAYVAIDAQRSRHDIYERQDIHEEKHDKQASSNARLSLFGSVGGGGSVVGVLELLRFLGVLG